MTQASDRRPSKIDTSRPHSARMYDYLLGGKDNFAADRETAELALKSVPAGRTAARENRAFLGRAVRYLVREAGVRQFLDVGTGLPGANNVHEVAQAAAPDARVVYVDNDPIVLTHARALLTGTPQGQIAFVDADLREPEQIVSHPTVLATLDFSQPVALMLVAVLHFLPDEYDPRGVVRTLVESLPSGSYLAASHVTAEHDPAGIGAVERIFRDQGIPVQARTACDVHQLFFTGMQLIDPGVVLVSEWRPEGSGPRPIPAEVSWNGGVAAIS
ncbi:MAG: SAM-dependent methyltransferase [Carbonactinosporaceae bacterium]